MRGTTSPRQLAQQFCLVTASLQGFGGAHVCLGMNKLFSLFATVIVAPLAAALVAALTMAIVIG